jgi:CBS domain-containing protein
MAAALKGQQLMNIPVEDTISGRVFSCKPDDDVHAALQIMQENRVRRLPVIAADGTLKGVLSMNDVVLKAEETKEKKLPELSYRDVVNTYKSICQHQLPAQAQGATGG